jgi:hypothetical protein
MAPQPVPAKFSRLLAPPDAEYSVSRYFIHFDFGHDSTNARLPTSPLELLNTILNAECHSVIAFAISSSSHLVAHLFIAISYFRLSLSQRQCVPGLIYFDDTT